MFHPKKHLCDAAISILSARLHKKVTENHVGWVERQRNPTMVFGGLRRKKTRLTHPTLRIRTRFCAELYLARHKLRQVGSSVLECGGEWLLPRGQAYMMSRPKTKYPPTHFALAGIAHEKGDLILLFGF